MKRLSVVATLAAGSASALMGVGESPGSVQTALMALETGAMERWRNGDPMGWAEISAPEVTYVDPSLVKPIVGRQQYAGYLESLKGKIHYEGSEFIEPRAEIYGDVAILTYVYRSTQDGAAGSAPQSTRWNTTEVYARAGADWKIIHTHWSYLDHGMPERLELPVPIEMARPTYPGVLGELMALESAAMERYRKGDPFGFTDISAPAVTYFDTGTPHRLDGLAALREEMARRTGQIRYEAMEFIEPMAQVHGDTAVLFYRFLATSLRSDGSIDHRSAWNCTEVFAKIDGAWKIVHTHWSLINGRPRQQTPAGPARDD